MWERTLRDLIRGLRANKNDESKFIAHAVDEIRNEVKSKDMELKAGAILKLIYVCVPLNRLPSNPLMSEPHPARDARIRYRLGLFPHSGSHVFRPEPPQVGWIPCCRAII